MSNNFNIPVLDVKCSVCDNKPLQLQQYEAYNYNNIYDPEPTIFLKTICLNCRSEVTLKTNYFDIVEHNNIYSFKKMVEKESDFVLKNKRRLKF